MPCSSAFSQNLIANGSFEDANGNKRCDGWFDACGGIAQQCDTGAVSACSGIITQDAPLGGGNWSFAAWGQGNQGSIPLETYVLGQTGTNVYQLSLWMKKQGNGSGGANISIKRQGLHTYINSLIADTSELSASL
ncbi:MAG TPA: hypothetical protein VNJ29_02925 [Candidatus Nitrosotenuis sp.]|nr:hypothetical protein [Candidatus Nitrosotenuis sp.]